VGPPSRQGSLRRHADEQCDRALAGLEPHTLIERGGSAIIAPDGRYLAGPVFDEETILYATLDLQEIDQNR